MAGDWIKMEASTPDKPEVFAIAARLGWDDPDLVVGKLFRVWRWFDQHTERGNAKNVTAALLDRIAGVTGFSDAMISVGWLHVSVDGLDLPNFDRHCGKTAKDRAETARRVAKHKAGRKANDDEESAARSLIPRPIRRAVMDRDGDSCVYCGRKEGEYAPPETARDAQLHIDHVIPVARGGTEDFQNLVCACGVCNLFKSDRTPDECGLKWPTLTDGTRLGNVNGNAAGIAEGNGKDVTSPLPREEKRIDKNKAAKKPADDVVLPNWLEPEVWAMWDQYRKQTGGRQWTHAAKLLSIRNLDELSAQGWRPREVVECSISRGYRGLFAPSNKAPAAGKSDAAMGAI